MKFKYISIIFLFLWLRKANATDCFRNEIGGIDVFNCLSKNPVQVQVTNLTDHLKLTVSYSDKILNFNLTKSKTKIINNDAVVWDFDTHRGLMKNQIYEFLPELKNIEYYFDEKNSTILEATSRNHEIILEGFLDGRYFLSYNLEKNKYELRYFMTLDQAILNYREVNSKYFNLESNKQSAELKLLIAIDNYGYLDLSKTTKDLVKTLLLQLTIVNMIFNKFTSPEIHLNIVGFFSSKYSLPDLLSDSADFDAVLKFSGLKKTINDDLISWTKVDSRSILIKNTNKPVFEHPLNTFTFMGPQYLSIAENVDHFIREEKLVEKFPFFINLPKAIKNLFKFKNIWTCTLEDPVEEKDVYENSDNSIHSSPNVRSLHPVVGSLKKDESINSNVKESNLFSSQTIVIIALIAGLVMMSLIVILIIVQYRKFRAILEVQNRMKNRAKPKDLLPENYQDDDDV